MNLIESENFGGALMELFHLMEYEGELVHTEKWQAMNIQKDPSARMVELLHTSLFVNLEYYRVDNEELQKNIEPNLPWADNHFKERVCGYPINPGVEWANWPWANKAQESLDENGQFNHNYMERYWPGEGVLSVPTQTAAQYKETQRQDDGSLTTFPKGIRHDYGDLEDLCELLAVEPSTRQAYLPIWFPEDTGTSHSGRKPCTLGYHFIMRRGKLDITYYIRSCDAFRHIRDDIYLTVLLGKYILARCKELKPDNWAGVTLGTFNMHITSLHMFINDYLALYKHKPYHG